MNSFKIIIIGFLLILGSNLQAQIEERKVEIAQISETIMNYIDGTANGELKKLKKAFHPNFNLYSVTEEDSLRIWNGEDYISNFKEGKKSNRVGRIISIDYEKNAATAKAEIIIPNWRIFTDYFLLLKYEGEWKIVHKSYTWRDFSDLNPVANHQENAVTDAEQKLIQTEIEGVDGWLKEGKRSKDFVVNETTLNAFGYRLLYNLNKHDDAIKVFELIIQLYPNSSNAYDSAAEGYKVSGDFDQSIEYYRKAIDLNGRVLFHQLGYLPARAYHPTILPEDTRELFQMEGSWDSETAFVYLQGGPDLQLNIGPWDGLHLMPNHSDLLKIYPLQAQMLNPEILTCIPTLTEKQSAYENAQSVEILDRVIRYLVAKKKKVVLIGHSYGSSICMEYVSSKDCLADKVVFMGLDLDEDISSWKTMKTGEYIRWKDGDKPYAKTVFGEIPNDHPSHASFNRVADNLGELVASNMAKKYTSLYDDEDFRKITSVYANQDEANGKKSEKEIMILKNKGTKIVEIEGDHHDMLTTEFMSDLYEYLMNEKPLKDKY